jgi:hypothetical protein
MSYRVRLAGPDDVPAIQELVAELLPGTDAARRYAWLYAGNPHGRALTWIAEANSGKTAAITSFFRRRLWVEGEEIGGALGGDGFVRTEYRRQGIMNAMHEACRRDMRGLGVEVMFGTPLPANVTPLTKAGCRTICDAIRYVRPLSGKVLGLSGLGERLMTPFLTPIRAGARLEPMVPGDARVDEIWLRSRADLRIATVRDAAFYTWRFLDSPSQQQKAYVIMDGKLALAACALETMDDVVRIVDLVAPSELWPRALRAIGAHCRGAAALSIRLNARDADARRMLRGGFFARDGKPFNLMVPVDSPREGVFYDPARWYFTWAESDMDRA